MTSQMIIKLNCRNDELLHFDVPDRKCGYSAGLVIWNHEIYTLVITALDPLPSYVRLPPITKIEIPWHCAASEKVEP